MVQPAAGCSACEKPGGRAAGGGGVSQTALITAEWLSNGAVTVAVHDMDLRISKQTDSLYISGVLICLCKVPLPS